MILLSSRILSKYDEKSPALFVETLRVVETAPS